MIDQPIPLAGTILSARASGALWWEAERLLCVADLHLGKAERIARRGGTLLPPYETAETISRLAAEVAALAPARVICLGDSFDDSAAGGALGEGDARALAVLTAGRDWIWIAGNHDPDPSALPGVHAAEAQVGPLRFRHVAARTASGEISGHYHPKLRLALPGGTVSRPCFLFDSHRLVLPAFGTYTGGLATDGPDLARLFGPEARAVMTGTPCVTVPLAASGRRPQRSRLRLA